MLICIKSWVLLENLFFFFFLNKNQLSQLDYSGVFSCVFMVGKYLVLGRKFGKKQLYYECEGNCPIYMRLRVRCVEEGASLVTFLAHVVKVSLFLLQRQLLSSSKNFHISYTHTPSSFSHSSKKEVNHLNPAQPENFQEESL